MTDTTARRAEADRIARADGHAIAAHDDDWTIFALADDTRTDAGTLRTCYEWVSSRFEGFVSVVAP